MVGADEAFFEDDRDDRTILNLYNENAGILDGEDDRDVDLASYAYQIWKNATDANPKLKTIIPKIDDVSYSTKHHAPKDNEPEGALVYVRTSEGTDSLAWVNQEGKNVTESQLTIINAARCDSETEGIPRAENHHELVRKGVEQIIEEEKSIGGQLRQPSGARFRTYERLKNYCEQNRDELFVTKELLSTVDEVYKYPLRQAAIDTLNRQLRGGVSDDVLAELVVTLRDEDRLCIIHEEEQIQEPRIICSMGLKNNS